tara:strand:- start:215 stop:439 length:225 start_codon:yes stop_codon:yes gene_type:complete
MSKEIKPKQVKRYNFKDYDEISAELCTAVMWYADTTNIESIPLKEVNAFLNGSDFTMPSLTKYLHKPLLATKEK